MISHAATAKSTAKIFSGIFSTVPCNENNFFFAYRSRKKEEIAERNSAPDFMVFNTPPCATDIVPFSSETITASASETSAIPKPAL